MSARGRMAACLVSALSLTGMLLAACGVEPPGATPAPSPTITEPILAASPTVLPVIPTGDGNAGQAVGASNPTLAGLAAEGQPVQDLPSATPQPTAAFLPLMISTSDGLILQATFYGSGGPAAPVALLLHQEGSRRADWEPLAQRLQAAGIAVLTVDLRGHGDTGGAVNWPLAQSDVAAAMAQLVELRGVDPARIVTVGASIGANLALNICADTPGCTGTVLLSPGLDYQGITTSEAMVRLGARPALIVASDNDNNNPADSLTLDGMAQGEHQLVVLPDAGHGMAMFVADPALLDQIASWIVAHVSTGIQ